MLEPLKNMIKIIYRIILSYLNFGQPTLTKTNRAEQMFGSTIGHKKLLSIF